MVEVNLTVSATRREGGCWVHKGQLIGLGLSYKVRMMTEGLFNLLGPQANVSRATRSSSAKARWCGERRLPTGPGLL